MCVVIGTTRLPCQRTQCSSHWKLSDFICVAESEWAFQTDNAGHIVRRTAVAVWNHKILKRFSLAIGPFRFVATVDATKHAGNQPPYTKKKQKEKKTERHEDRSTLAEEKEERK